MVKNVPWLHLNYVLSVWLHRGFFFIIYIGSTDVDAHETV